MRTVGLSCAASGLRSVGQVTVNGAPPPDTAGRPPSGHKPLRWLARGAGVVVLVVAIEYVVLPQLSGARQTLGLLAEIRVPFLVLAVVLEVAALLAYSMLTRTLLAGPGRPSLPTLFRIDLSAYGLSHVVPAGGAGSTALRYRLLTVAGTRHPDAVFDTVVQPVGSAIVLTLMLWLALLIALPRDGAQQSFTIGAAAGLVLFTVTGAVLFALFHGRRGTVRVVRAVAARIPRAGADRAEAQIRRLAEHLRQLSGDRRQLATAVAWAAVNWLLDAAALWVVLASFGQPLDLHRLFIAYALANMLAMVPITPGGVGVVEGVLVPTLVVAGASHSIAILGVLIWRLVNFWLPIPVGGLAYLSLRAGPLRSRVHP